MYKVAITISKLINKLIKQLKLGSGNTLPGYVVLKIFPNLKQHIFNSLPNKLVLITGTNGKTTTTKMLVSILELSGKKVLTNSSGANLLNGIATTILVNSNPKDSLVYDVAVLEVDEAFLPRLCKFCRPSHVAFLNLSRDQLDRHWETDIIFEKWLECSKNLNNTKLFLNSEHPKIKSIDQYVSRSNIIYFDSKIEENIEIHIPKGRHNKLNFSCALKIAEDFGVSKRTIFASDSLSFDAAFGRGEVIEKDSVQYTTLLAKNPASLNINLETILESYASADAILFVLNDNIPDGHDVSWIYDVKPNLIKEACVNKKVYVSGKRYLDMAIRINYTGTNLDEKNISESLESLVRKINQDDCKKVVVLPNYSAMLEFRKIVTGKAIL